MVPLMNSAIMIAPNGPPHAQNDSARAKRKPISKDNINHYKLASQVLQPAREYQRRVDSVAPSVRCCECVSPLRGNAHPANLARQHMAWRKNRRRPGLTAQRLDRAAISLAGYRRQARNEEPSSLGCGVARSGAPQSRTHSLAAAEGGSSRPGCCAARSDTLLIRARELAAIRRREPFRLGDVVHGVGVEEWIERRGRPGHGGEPESRGPAVDLPDVLDNKCVAKLFAQGDAP